MQPSHGFLSLTPYFTVADADALIRFCQIVFDAEILKDSRHDDGTVQHVRLQIKDSLIMLNQATEEFAATVSQMHLYVDDVEATYQLALAEGADSLMAPMQRPHGDRMAGFVDPTGNIWWVASAAVLRFVFVSFNLG